MQIPGRNSPPDKIRMAESSRFGQVAVASLPRTSFALLSSSGQFISIFTHLKDGLPIYSA